MEKSIAISLGGQRFTANKARLGEYLKLQTALRELGKASKAQDTGKIADALFKYLNIAIPELKRGIFNAAAWYDIFVAQQIIFDLNTIKGDFAILEVGSEIKEKPVPWDYDDRDRAVILNIFAKTYNWNLEIIENLWPATAIGLLQEILADEQFEREFHHSLSQIGYRYNRLTKKSHYQPLHRPLWMVARKKEQIITKIPKDLMPAGKIIRADEDV